MRKSQRGLRLQNSILSTSACQDFLIQDAAHKNITLSLGHCFNKQRSLLHTVCLFPLRCHWTHKDACWVIHTPECQWIGWGPWFQVISLFQVSPDEFSGLSLHLGLMSQYNKLLEAHCKEYNTVMTGKQILFFVNHMTPTSNRTTEIIKAVLWSLFKATCRNTYVTIFNWRNVAVYSKYNVHEYM